MAKKFFVFAFLVFAISKAFAQTPTYNIGEMHNKVVDYIDKYDFTGKDENAFMDDLIYTTARMYEPNAFSAGKGGIWGVIQICGKADPGPLDPLNNKTYSYSEVVDINTSKGNITNASASYLKNLETVLDNSTDYNDFAQKITNLQNSFSIAALPDAEKNIVQGCTDVLKSSALYWNNFAQAQQSALRWNWRCILCVAFNDLKGAILGFAAGMCICKKLGIPADPRVCGAIGATIFGALWSWAAKVCPDKCTKCYKPNPSTYPAFICKITRWL